MVRASYFKEDDDEDPLAMDSGSGLDGDKSPPPDYNAGKSLILFSIFVPSEHTSFFSYQKLASFFFIREWKGKVAREWKEIQ